MDESVNDLPKRELTAEAVQRRRKNGFVRVLHRLLHGLAEKARGLAARRGPVRLPFASHSEFRSEFSPQERP